MKQLDRFHIIGISMRTSNTGNSAAEDIGQLWQKFYTENLIERIPNQVSDDIYSIYTDYETDYRGSYTTIIGMKVSTLKDIPEGLEGRSVDGGTYQIFHAKGKMPQAIVETWQHIWKVDKSLERSYTADFEIYGPKSQDPNGPEVDIYVAIESRERA